MRDLSVHFEEPRYLTREDAMMHVDLIEHIREEEKENESTR